LAEDEDVVVLLRRVKRRCAGDEEGMVSIIMIAGVLKVRFDAGVDPRTTAQGDSGGMFRRYRWAVGGARDGATTPCGTRRDPLTAQGVSDGREG
jgi:hypothetical protein